MQKRIFAFDHQNYFCVFRTCQASGDFVKIGFHHRCLTWSKIRLCGSTALDHKTDDSHSGNLENQNLTR